MKEQRRITNKLVILNLTAVVYSSESTYESRVQKLILDQVIDVFWISGKAMI